tara:strand:+ start:1029 stop:3407 length:2379 start_codon:yes stop_codon:yes gene_type:complete
MKNKLFKLTLIIFFLLTNYVSGQEFIFKTRKIEINEKGNFVKAYEGQAISKDGDLEISGEVFDYDKKKNILEINEKGSIFIKSQNIQIFFNKSVVNQTKKTIESSGDIIILDNNNNLNIKSKYLFYDKNLNQISSDTKTVIEDGFQNKYFVENFFYELDKNLLKVKNLVFEDRNKNILKTNLAFINTKTNKMFGKDLSLELNANNNNEPRLKGNSVINDDNFTEINKGNFTTCKKRDGCPPWQLTAKKIIHDKKRKIINYENATLRIYDKPVFYFPKFFHPDPTVKRQSGFLIPSFSTSNNYSNYINTPYFYVIAENKDLTVSPRLYSNNNFLIQSEYRQVNSNSSHILDFSYFNENETSDSNHLFYKLSKFLNFEKFEISKLDFRLQQTSDDTYLKKNKIKSKIIDDIDVLENSINLNMYSNDLSVDLEATSYENLDRKGNDRYEFIAPKIRLIKNIDNKTNLDGDLIWESETLIRNYNTNITEKSNINNLVFNSNPTITKSGFYNDYEFIIKNSNTDSENSKNFKDNKNSNLTGIFQFNSSFPLIRKTDFYENIFKPKLSLKIAPPHTKNYKDDEVDININNVYSLNRINKNDTVEGGVSITYGGDYSILNSSNDFELINFKIANNIRINENEDLTSSHQINQKTSNFFTETLINPNKFISIKYNSSIRNNLSEISSETLLSEFKFKDFSTSFTYLNENSTSKNNSYILNETSYNLDDSNQLMFSTRKNKKTDLTEFYKLIYQYKNDCLAASIEYNKDYYNDRELKPEENIFLKLSIIPFGQTTSPNLKN